MDDQQRIGASAWGTRYDSLNPFPRIHTKHEEKTRRFVDAVFWIVRRGAPWRLLPQADGEWNVVYQRFTDWAERGGWYKMLYAFAHDPDMDSSMGDSTILRAHACAAGAVKKARHAKRARPRALPGRV